MRPFPALLTLPVLILACVIEPNDTPTEVLAPEPALTSGAPVLDAFGFVGYRVPGQKLNACSECHADNQRSWIATEHADALQDVLRTDIELLYCRPCHTVNGLGNWVQEPAGYEELRTRKFADVQCESCHGPGEAHLADPTVFPLAALNTGINLPWGCGECHEGMHHPFVEQWAESDHAQVASVTANRPECDGCHEGRAALIETFLETSNYMELSEAQLVPITCAVCHDPHGSGHGQDVRADVTAQSKDNLCIRCHSRRGEPMGWRGPHGAEGLLLLAEDVGWIPDGFESPGPHAHASQNGGLCVTCHMPIFSVYDPAGMFLLTSVGHLFEPIACLDAEGVPYAGECDVSERDFRACVPCHDDEAGARQAYLDTRADINQLLDQIWTDDNGNGAIDSGDSGVLAEVVALGDPNSLDLWDNGVTVADGALWNALLARTADRPAFAGGTVFGKAFGLPGHAAAGNGVHNPDFLRQLLAASIAAVVAEHLTP